MTPAPPTAAVLDAIEAVLDRARCTRCRTLSSRLHVHPARLCPTCVEALIEAHFAR